MNIAFFIRQFSERGTEVAIYDYAKYNEDILRNKSYILCFHSETQKRLRFPMDRDSYDTFNKRFPIIEIKDIAEMPHIIQCLDLSYFYTLTYGGANDIYQFENKKIWDGCKTIKHCVFETTYPESDFYIGISDCLNEKYGTDLPIIPHIVHLPCSNGEHFRKQLGIPDDSIVYGRYGGYTEFNIVDAHQAIVDYLQMDDTCYFVFMNTAPFFYHPRIIYLDKSVDIDTKVKFIQTCDVMIHGREAGETFGLSIAEFSIMNKPVITCPCGDLEHVRILGDKGIYYRSKKELVDIFKKSREIFASRDIWNAYTGYTPEHVMSLFTKYIFSNDYS
jgi:hypothetical protein